MKDVTKKKSNKKSDRDSKVATAFFLFTVCIGAVYGLTAFFKTWMYFFGTFLACHVLSQVFGAIAEYRSKNGRTR